MKRILLINGILMIFFGACAATGIDRTALNSKKKTEAARLLAAGNFNATLELLEYVIREDPLDAESLSLRAETLWKSGEFVLALQDFESSLRLDYSSCRTHMLLALMLMEHGKTGRAVTEFKLAAEYGANEGLPHYNYGLALYKLNKIDDALKQFREACGLDDTNPEYAAALGMAYSGRDDDRALEYFEKARLLGENGVSFHENFGLLLIKLKLFDRAAEHLEIALKQAPDNIEYMFNISSLFMKSGSYKKAVPVWKMLVKRQPAKRSHKIYLASALFKLGRFGEAVETLEAEAEKWGKEGAVVNRGGFEEIPTLDQGYEILSLSSKELGDLARAQAYMEKAVLLAPDNPAYLNNYGAILAGRGNIKKALKQWRRVLMIDPSNETAKKNLSVHSR